MATSLEPLLSSSHKKSSSSKAFYTFLCLVAIVGSAALLSKWIITTNSSSSSSTFHARICNGAHDPTSCMSILSEVSSSSPTESNGVDLLQMLLHSSLRRTRAAMDMLTNVNGRVNGRKVKSGLNTCMLLMDLSVDWITDSMVALGNPTPNARSDAHTYLSSVLTNHDTCLDGLHGPARSTLEPILNDLIARARSSLAVFVAVAPPAARQDDLRLLNGEFPSWVLPRDRRLLESRVNAAVASDVVVAADGSGDYKTVSEAVNAAPDSGTARYVIYVKKGTYAEKVAIGKLKTNLMLVGDGMDATIITGSASVDDGKATSETATVAALGAGFMAQDICFQNTAAPPKEQAVAIMVGSDQSVFNRVKIDGYQDSLYAYAGRQFYQECSITGTVDFIFGNGAVVFQNSQIMARKPAHGQPTCISAQGRLDPNQNTGLSFQNCKVIPGPDLEPVKAENKKTMLGRPWKLYSRTMYMQSYMDDHIDPLGWEPFSGTAGLDTCDYAEYMNTGPGAGTGQRVQWKGYHAITNAADAQPFTVDKLLQGDSWLKASGVSYTLGL
ncbi:unnamed protein product [Cuscuta europaea]|uniref:Pectinesterase n=1 Tax=Cuscuta europaea TaxID=41803 RepID=A0A9P1DYE1_CUSEU|nr:unnamed protein product [Cuscuta europaea]